MPQAQQIESLWSGLRDNSGNPLAGGKVFTYRAGTLSNKSTYTEQDKSQSASNPIILDAYGRAQIFADGAYKLVVKDEDDNTIQTLDDMVYGHDDGELLFGGTSGGTGNAQTISIAGLTALADGMKLGFIAGNSNSGAATLNPSSLGAISMKKGSGNYDLTTGDLVAGNYYEAIYQSAGPRFKLVHVTNWEENNVSHRARNAAGSADVNLFKLNALDQLELYGAWAIKSDGHIKSLNGSNLDIGDVSTPNLVRNLCAINLLCANNDQLLGTTTTHNLLMQTHGITRWYIGGTDGEFIPWADNTTEMGAPSRIIKKIWTKAIDGLPLTTWTPTLAAGGSMTYTSTSITYARYYQIGKLVFIFVRITGTTGGSASNTLTFTAPVNAASIGGAQAWGGQIQNAGATAEAASFEIQSGGNVVTVRRYNDSNYSLGSGTQIICTACYEAA